MPLFPIVQKHRIQWQWIYCLEDHLLLTGYNFNYMNYSRANYLRKSLVDHGTSGTHDSQRSLPFLEDHRRNIDSKLGQTFHRMQWASQSLTVKQQSVVLHMHAGGGPRSSRLRRTCSSRFIDSETRTRTRTRIESLCCCSRGSLAPVFARKRVAC